MLSIIKNICHWFLHKSWQDTRFIRVMIKDSIRSPIQPQCISLLSEEEDNFAIWIGHATVLFKLNGKIILTDPVFYNKVGPKILGIKFGPKRYIAPAIKIENLPPIDILLISHAHFDHLDIESIRNLPPIKNIITAENTKDLINNIPNLQDSNIIEISSNFDVINLEKIQITTLPVKHIGARVRYDINRKCNAYNIACNKYSITYIADTAYDENLFNYNIFANSIAFVPIGTYNPYIKHHCNPEQAIQIASLLQARVIIPIHYKTFNLSQETISEPLERFINANNRCVKKIILEIGEIYKIE